MDVVSNISSINIMSNRLISNMLALSQLLSHGCFQKTRKHISRTEKQVYLMQYKKLYIVYTEIQCKANRKPNIK